MSRRAIAWTVEMDATLIRLRGERKPIAVCAAHFGVSAQAITNRMDKLRLSGLRQRHNGDGAAALESAGMAVDADEEEDADRDPLPSFHEISCRDLNPDPREYLGAR